MAWDCVGECMACRDSGGDGTLEWARARPWAYDGAAQAGEGGLDLVSRRCCAAARVALRCCGCGAAGPAQVQLAAELTELLADASERRCTARDAAHGEAWTSRAPWTTRLRRTRAAAEAAADGTRGRGRRRPDRPCAQAAAADLGGAVIHVYGKDEKARSPPVTRCGTAANRAAAVLVREPGSAARPGAAAWTPPPPRPASPKVLWRGPSSRPTPPASSPGRDACNRPRKPSSAPYRSRSWSVPDDPGTPSPATPPPA